jgi:DNA-binding IclR family transcriptional regulator
VSPRVQVIDRSWDLLEALSDGPRTLTQICRATGFPKATAFRLLGGLISRDLVLKGTADNTYMLGPGLLRLAQGALSGVGVISTVGRQVLFELSELTGETTTLHTQSGLERMSLEEVPGRHSIRYSSVSGGVAPIHNASVGAVLLAFSSEQNRERTLALIAGADPDFDRQTLEARLDRTRRDGWAISVAERVPDATAISVPVRSEQLLLALSVMGPIERLTPATLKRFVPAMQQAAERLVGVLDAQPPLPLDQP